MERIRCSRCGEPIATVRRLKEIVEFCKEFWGQCSCGQRYRLIESPTGAVVLCFPDTQLEIIL
jgi:hypothetical protein